jgi:cytochrome b pre-mRNA-processing protein 3
MRFFGLFKDSRQDQAARDLYQAIVRQGRRPGFYTACGVPDSPDGRFDMIALHAFLVLRRLKRPAPGETAALAQALFDLMFADMDQNLREMGVGDLSVGRRVKALAQAFYGRVAAYDEGLDGDEATLRAAVRRNVYRHARPSEAQVAAVADYMRRVDRDLAAYDLSRLMAGELSFGPAPGDKDSASETST